MTVKLAPLCRCEHSCQLIEKDFGHVKVGHDFSRSLEVSFSNRDFVEIRWFQGDFCGHDFGALALWSWGDVNIESHTLIDRLEVMRPNGDERKLPGLLNDCFCDLGINRHKVSLSSGLRCGLVPSASQVQSYNSELRIATQCVCFSIVVLLRAPVVGLDLLASPRIKVCLRYSAALPYDLYGLFGSGFILCLLWFVAAIGWSSSLGVWTIGVASLAVVSLYMFMRSVRPADVSQCKARITTQR